VENQVLVEFRVKNFRSFRDEQVLSLVAGNDKTLDENCATEGKLRLLKAAGIYGPNASGKSNLIKAMSFVRELVVRSTESKPGWDLLLKPFLLDDQSRKRQSFFEVTFIQNNIRYQYGFTATSKYIQDEWLIAYPKGRAQKWYQRSLHEQSGEPCINFGPALKGDRAKLAKMTRNNVLFLSVGAQWNNKQLMNVYEWFKDKFRVLTTNVTLYPVTASMLHSPNGNIVEKDSLRDFVIESMRKADLGISEVSVREVTFDEVKFPEDIPEVIREKFLEDIKNKPLLKVEMLHRVERTGKNAVFALEEESDGTQRFFQLIGPWLQAIEQGITVCVDELESSMHPLLTRELVKFIQKSKYFESAPQLIFATHDTTLLDPNLLRRDQVWFTEKDEAGATNLYSMSDYKERPVRKGEAMQKGYLAGRYGAVPILDAFGTSNG